MGAIFFLATLGGIAFYVQNQSIPEDRDELRKPATLLPDVIEDNAPPPLAWRNRLDLGAIELTPVLEAGAEPPAAAIGAENGGALQIDPAKARYVQNLADGHRLLYTLDPVMQQSAETIFRNREVP
ncbi:MAG: hypothetical protein KC431_22610, partial [Myxococcales bacterium]|nr:hypothetical protein [Myxococcales bacterium]